MHVADHIVPWLALNRDFFAVSRARLRGQNVDVCGQIRADGRPPFGQNSVWRSGTERESGEGRIEDNDAVSMTSDRAGLVGG
eukprot:1427866-Rhodomonas_salina.4